MTNCMRVVDLFCGAGGSSEGARQAGCEVLVAANHWPLAVQYHSANHPETLHITQDLQQANFHEFPAHDILMASPACQGHSPARGAEKPHHDVQRATAWAVVTCAEARRPPVVVVENVREFATRWVLYKAWCAAMHALGYALAPMVLDAADSGVPQNRRRLFIVATRSKHPITLRMPQRAHLPASSFVDFDAGTWSPIHTPKRKPRTLARIAAGRRRFGQRFLAPYYGSGSGETGRSLDRPIGTITTKDRWAVIDGERMRMLLPDEARAAMGFPAGYLLPEDGKSAMHLMGNAVVPTQMRDLLQAVMEVA